MTELLVIAANIFFYNSAVFNLGDNGRIFKRAVFPGEEIPEAAVNDYFALTKPDFINRFMVVNHFLNYFNHSPGMLLFRHGIIVLVPLDRNVRIDLLVFDERQQSPQSV